MKTYIGIKIIKAETQTCPSNRHKSKAGDPGYKVEYKDGYISWSPESVFDDAYCRIDSMPFSIALEAMRKGYKVMRRGWNGGGMHLEAQFPDKCSKMTHPYLFIVVPGCEERTRLLPWQPAQVDIFSEDWQIIDE